MLRRRRPDSQVTEYPQGVFLKTEKGYFFVHSNTTRLHVTTKRVLNSWSPQQVIITSEGDHAVKALRISTSKMKFRNGSLLYSQASGRMYLVSANKLRHIINPDVLTALGRKRSAAVWVSLDEINLHEKGEPLA